MATQFPRYLGVPIAIGLSFSLAFLPKEWGTVAFAQPASLGQNSTSSKVFSGKGFSLELPTHFVGGNFEQERQAILDKVASLGKDFAATLPAVKQANFVFYAVDPNVGKMGEITNVNGIVSNIPASLSLEQIFGDTIKQLPVPIKVVEQKIIQLPKYRAGQIITDWTVGKARIKQVLYLIVHAQKVYAFTYTTSFAEFPDRYPTFQASIASLNLGAP